MIPENPFSKICKWKKNEPESRNMLNWIVSWSSLIKENADVNFFYPHLKSLCTRDESKVSLPFLKKATFASIGAAGIPQAGLVTLIMVLNTVGLPATDAALILSVDWLLDRYVQRNNSLSILGENIGKSVIKICCG